MGGGGGGGGPSKGAVAQHVQTPGQRDHLPAHQSHFTTPGQPRGVGVTPRTPAFSSNFSRSVHTPASHVRGGLQGTPQTAGGGAGGEVEEGEYPPVRRRRCQNSLDDICKAYLRYVRVFFLVGLFCQMHRTVLYSVHSAVSAYWNSPTFSSRASSRGLPRSHTSSALLQYM